MLPRVAPPRELSYPAGTRRGFILLLATAIHRPPAVRRIRGFRLSSPAGGETHHDPARRHASALRRSRSSGSRHGPQLARPGRDVGDGCASRELKRPTASSNAGRDRTPVGGAVRPGARTGSAGGPISPPSLSAGGDRISLWRRWSVRAIRRCVPRLPAAGTLHSRSTPPVHIAPHGLGVCRLPSGMGEDPDARRPTFLVRRVDRRHSGEPGATLRPRRMNQEQCR